MGEGSLDLFGTSHFSTFVPDRNSHFLEFSSGERILCNIKGTDCESMELFEFRFFDGNYGLTDFCDDSTRIIFDDISNGLGILDGNHRLTSYHDALQIFDPDSPRSALGIFDPASPRSALGIFDPDSPRSALWIFDPDTPRSALWILDNENKLEYTKSYGNYGLKQCLGLQVLSEARTICNVKGMNSAESMFVGLNGNGFNMQCEYMFYALFLNFDDFSFDNFGNLQCAFEDTITQMEFRVFHE